MTKKFALTLVAAFALVFSVTAGETDKKALSEKSSVKTALINLENDYVQLRMVKSPEDIVKVKITRQNGSVAFVDKFKNRNQVAVSYNLGDLNPGHYTVNIEKNGELVKSYPVSTRVTNPCQGK